jgi:Mg2+ and Co2+ transporter CorA
MVITVPHIYGRNLWDELPEHARAFKPERLFCIGGLMLVIAVLQIVYFCRKRWL